MIRLFMHIIRIVHLWRRVRRNYLGVVMFGSITRERLIGIRFNNLLIWLWRHIRMIRLGYHINITNFSNTSSRNLRLICKESFLNLLLVNKGSKYFKRIRINLSFITRNPVIVAKDLEVFMKKSLSNKKTTTLGSTVLTTTQTNRKDWKTTTQRQFSWCTKKTI